MCSNPLVAPGEVSGEVSRYVDKNGDCAYVPAGFRVTEEADGQTIAGGLVIIGPDESEFVWVPVTKTRFSIRAFGCYFYGGTIDDYHDDTSLASYKEMAASVQKYGGFYMGRYEASRGGGDSLANYVPASRPVTKDRPGRIWVQFSPQDATIVCGNLYKDNPTVRAFFPWGINWDTTLQWFIDSKALTEHQVKSDSSSWGNYSNSGLTSYSRCNSTGAFEQTKVNNIYDMAGNNWEWTQERYGSWYVMRGGGYTIMGGPCTGNSCPAALRDPLPGSSHHPNVTFRVALYVI